MIAFTKKEDVRQKMMAYFNQFTREPRGSEEYWQKLLTEYDPELHLRFNPVSGHYLIYYDHNGLPEVIRTFKPGESFWCAFKNIKHNATLNKRRQLEMLDTERERQERQIEETIDEAKDEYFNELMKMARRKVVTDSVVDNKY